jgi:hypothetical protein
MRPLLIACIVSLAVSFPSRAADPPLVVHEWGTFTTIHDEAGEPLGGVNSEDEPLPKFVHDLAWDWTVGSAADQYQNHMRKGYPQCHPEVTMRLETPVIYFHTNGSNVRSADLEVQFRGGYLTQFYPDAEAGKIEHHISGSTLSHLSWHDVKLGGDEGGPDTPCHVWTAPRAVDAANVSVATQNREGRHDAPKVESERFLFYRGVGHIDAPLRLPHETSTVEVRGHLDPAITEVTHLDIPRVWFCQFKDGGHCAYRELGPMTVTSDSRTALASTPLDFRGEDFTAEHLESLTKSMRAALIEDGLFADEADALLSTWKLSYFQSAGTRLFFIVPHDWTNHYLPMTVAPAAGVAVQVKRVMVGRIDLVTPHHRELLRRIASDPDVRGHDAELWKVYDQLGRFRNALVLDEQKRRPSASMEMFIGEHGLEGLR